MTSAPVFRQRLSAAAHLLVIGLGGPVVVGVLGMLMGFTIGFIPLLGLGLLVLPVFVWLLSGTARFERMRVAGLFGYDTGTHTLPTSDRTDGWRWLHTAWLRLIYAPTWLGVLHFVIMTALGSAAIALLQTATRLVSAAVSALFDPLAPARVPNSTLDFAGWGVALVCLVLTAVVAFGLYGLGSAHRGISRMLIPSRTQELEHAAQVATQRRDDAMSAATVERSRIERDLHDGVQPRLVSIGLTLGMAKTKIESDPQQAAALIDEAHASTKEAITELRQLARGFRPAVLDDRGLDAALSALAARSPIPVELDVRMDGRCGEATEAAMYFAVAESLTNAAKHSGAASCRVTILSRPGGMLWGRMEDDGRGGATIIAGGGLDGLVRRVQAAGGILTLTSPEGGPTTIEVSLPCAL